MAAKPKPTDKPPELRSTKEQGQSKRASAVAKPKAEGMQEVMQEVSIEETDDQPDSDDSDSDGSDGLSYSYYSSESSKDDDKQRAKEEKERAKDRAKYRGFSCSPSPKKMPQKHRTGSAVANQSKATSSQSKATSRKRSDVAAPSGARSPNKSAAKDSAVASSPTDSAVASPRRRRQITKSDGDLANDVYLRRSGGQFFYGISKNCKARYRARASEGFDKKACGQLNLPITTWMLDKDCPPDEIEEFILGNAAKKEHILLIYIDKAPDENSVAHEKLCSMADQERQIRCEGSDDAGPGRKSVFRIGKPRHGTFAFVVCHRSFIHNGMYDDHTPIADDIKETSPYLRFGTLHLALSQERQAAKHICIGIVDLRRAPPDRIPLLDSGDATMLALWTHCERHDMVFVNAGNDFDHDTWYQFGVGSQARSFGPQFQPFLIRPSAVATAGGSQMTLPLMMFMYGEFDVLRMPAADQLTCLVDGSIGRLQENITNVNVLPRWVEASQSRGPQDRQHLGSIVMKPVDWNACPSFCVPFRIWLGKPKAGRAGKNQQKQKGQEPTSCRGEAVDSTKASVEYNFDPDPHAKRNGSSNGKGKGKCRDGKHRPWQQHHSAASWSNRPKPPDVPPPPARYPTQPDHPPPHRYPTQPDHPLPRSDRSPSRPRNRERSRPRYLSPSRPRARSPSRPRGRSPSQPRPYCSVPLPAPSRSPSPQYRGHPWRERRAVGHTSVIGGDQRADYTDNGESEEDGRPPRKRGIGQKAILRPNIAANAHWRERELELQRQQFDRVRLFELRNQQLAREREQELRNQQRARGIGHGRSRSPTRAIDRMTARAVSCRDQRVSYAEGTNFTRRGTPCPRGKTPVPWRPEADRNSVQSDRVNRVPIRAFSPQHRDLSDRHSSSLNRPVFSAPAQICIPDSSSPYGAHSVHTRSSSSSTPKAVVNQAQNVYFR